jgi:putative ABC transport system ATP-binding protein
LPRERFASGAGQSIKRESSILVEARGLSRSYQRGNQTVEALRDVDLTIDEGEFVTVMGPSGCGKSTLLHLLGGIDRPTSGQISVDGRDLAIMSEEELTRFRKENVGFVFQFYNLLPTLSAFENVELPLIAQRQPRRDRRRRARAALRAVGLEHRFDHRPGELSGGQQQRVAIARAMVAEPKLVLADEPTGDLDSGSARVVVDLMQELNERLGLTFVVVTHDPVVAQSGRRMIRLKDGEIAEGDAGSV